MDHHVEGLTAIANQAKALVRAAEVQSGYHDDGRVILRAADVRALAATIEAWVAGEQPTVGRKPWDLQECSCRGCPRHVTEPHAVYCHACRTENHAHPRPKADVFAGVQSE